MKRTAMSVAILSVAVWATAQTYGQAGQQTPPATTPAAQGGQAAPAGQTAPAPGAAITPAKRPPQAKTDPEFNAWKAADAGSRPTPEEQAEAQKNPADTQKIMAAVADRAEKAAEDFATKFPDSEVRILLYKGATEIIAEKTRETDIDRDQRYDEAMKMVQKALTTVDTDISVPAGTPQDRLDAYKSGLRSQAYSTMGAITYSKNDFAGAQANFQKAIDAFPSQPFPADVLRLALALDKQQKYEEALKVATRAVELSPENTPIGTSARRERDRLQQLTGGAPVPAQPQTQPPKN